jgi:hypothetical protein
MSSTGLQQYIDISLDGNKTYSVEINIYSPSPMHGVISTSEVLEPSVESIVQVAEETLQGTHGDSVIVFKFPKTEDTIECFRHGGEIIIRKTTVCRE